MMDDLPSAAHADHLTDALRRSGVLGSGRVCDVAVDSSRNTILSRITWLRLTYDGAPDATPRSLILKTGLPDRAKGGWNAGRQEVAFYAEVGTAGASIPAPTISPT